MRQKRLDRKEGIESARRWKSGGERERENRNLGGGAIRWNGKKRHEETGRKTVIVRILEIRAVLFCFSCFQLVS